MTKTSQRLPGSGIEIAEDTDATADLIESELLATLRASLTQSSNKRFVLSARNKRGDLVGGLTANTSYSWVLIKTLWVDDAFRQQGIGRNLVARMHAIAKEIGCHSAWLDTSSPDAMQFYGKLGYSEFGLLANKADQEPSTHRRWFMKKTL